VGVEHGSGQARAEYHASLGLSPVEAEDDAVIYYHDLVPGLRAEAQARTWQDQSMKPLDEPVNGGHMVALSNPAALADRLEAYRLEVQGERRDAGR